MARIWPQQTALGNQRRFVSRRLNKCLCSHSTMKLLPLRANYETDRFPDWCWSSSDMPCHCLTFDIDFSCLYLTCEFTFWKIFFLWTVLECGSHVGKNVLLESKARGWLWHRGRVCVPTSKLYLLDMKPKARDPTGMNMMERVSENACESSWRCGGGHLSGSRDRASP